MRSILIASRLACLAAPTLAGRRQRGGLLDAAPPGRLPSSPCGAVEAFRCDDPAGRRDPCAVHLRSGAPAQAPIKDRLDATSQEPLLPGHREPVTAAFEPRVIETAPRTVTTTATTATPLDDVVVGLAAKAGHRYQLLAFEGPAADDLALHRSLAVLEGESRPCPQGVEPVSEGADPLLPRSGLS